MEQELRNKVKEAAKEYYKEVYGKKREFDYIYVQYFNEFRLLLSRLHISYPIVKTICFVIKCLSTRSNTSKSVISFTINFVCL